MTTNLGNSALARVKLEQAIENGRAVGSRIIPRIYDEVPQDEIQAAKETRLVLSPGKAEYQTRHATSPISSFALAQLCDRVGGAKFAAYAAEQLALSKPRVVERRNGQTEIDDSEAWRAQHLQEVAAGHFEHARGRYLIRRVGGGVRGVLSDSFKRVDVRPMFDAFLGAVQARGAVAAGGEITETRAVVRVLIPRIYEPTPGEMVVYGMQFANSDFGAGNYALSDFVLRLLCLNGMTGDKQLRQIHLGKRISEDVELSAKTHDLDTKTLVSATIDTVGKLVSDVVLDKRTRAIGDLAREELTFEAAFRQVAKKMSKAEKEAAEELYEGPDVLNVPQGKTMWRFANALSFLANDEKKIKDPDRRIELQEIAGRLLPQVKG